MLKPSAANLSKRLRGLRHLALDLDGTLYRGGRLFPQTLPFLKALRDLGIGYTFLTNNSSRSRSDYLKKLRALQLPIGRADIYTSTHATIDFLRRRHPRARCLLALGTRSFRAEMRRAGYRLLPADAGRHAAVGPRPDLVLVAFDQELTYDRLCRAAYWLKQGKPFVATHPDFVCPSDPTTVLVDCGSICAALTAATGRRATAIGKPNPEILRSLARRHAMRTGQMGVVGDRLYTDIALAQATGAVSILVLTGEATARDARQAQPAPEVVVKHVGELARLLRAARKGQKGQKVANG